ncbi:MAG TPA: sigma-54 dependent transcriptional regulator [Gemmatimonadales bacterium]|nr:sigma-54 dependent transcriptional regulator [Gemmatimonadales bacterium]
MSVLVVVRLSDSFADVWPQLAEGLDVELAVVVPNGVDGVPPSAAAVLLAAGGAEREARDWLDRHAIPLGVPVFVVGSDPGRRAAAQAVAQGAADYFALPEDVEILSNALTVAVERRRRAAARTAADDAADDLAPFQDIAGESPALREVLKRATRLLRHAHGTALIIGETGTGKELLARAIHDGGPRRGAPFVPVNCSALPRGLIESELFGHEKGAFTDAHAAKPGLFEIADGGTLFLDELDTLPVDLQAKLLRVLEDHEIRRVGGTKSRKVNVRVLAASNANLEAAVQHGTLRPDLYFRLGVVTLELPPLRERGGDVAIIATRLLVSLAAHHRLPVPPLSAEARRALATHPWPGNVRELKNALERALLLSPAGELDLAELVPRVHTSAGSAGSLPFPAPLDAITTAAARAMLDLCSGSVSEAARRLSVSRRRLRRLAQTSRATAGAALAD